MLRPGSGSGSEWRAQVSFEEFTAWWRDQRLASASVDFEDGARSGGSSGRSSSRKSPK
jgi:hypothetical protein